MQEWNIRIMYCRFAKPPPVWLTIKELKKAAEISDCTVSLQDGGVLFRKPGYRCLQFATETFKPLKDLEGDAFTINKHKDVVLKIRCEGKRLTKIQIAKFIATLLHCISIPEKWCVYTGYLEDLRKYYK